MIKNNEEDESETVSYIITYNTSVIFLYYKYTNGRKGGLSSPCQRYFTSSETIFASDTLK
jgi:hypothetical protein